MRIPWVNHAVRWLRLPLRSVTSRFGFLSFLSSLIALDSHHWSLIFLIVEQTYVRDVEYRGTFMEEVPISVNWLKA